LGIRGQLLTIVLAALLPLPLFALFFARENFIAFVLAGLAAGFCAGGAAILIARNIGGRLRLLDNAARKIEEGDFTARLPVRAETGADEITALEKSFNRMAERVVERRNRFTELDTLKSDFVSSVSHELRTPLTTIKALTRLLMRGEELADEKRREYLETISVECDRQIDLVLNLLDLSRLEGGVFRVSLERVDVAEVIRSCVKSETSAAERRRHKLEIEPNGEVPPVCADPKALRRVLSNLIENSIKYTPDGGLITLFAYREGDFVSISVRDNGRGIPPEDLPVLFDKFHRGRPAPHSAAMRNATETAEFLEDADVSGVGLGLYLGKNVMERMGGRIAVETEVGRGSRFTLHLPVWKAETCGDSSKEKGNGEKITGR
jgi:two-component system, NarL family, sensor histidine kinase BarA